MSHDPTAASLRLTIPLSPGAGPPRSGRPLAEVSPSQVALVVGEPPRFADEIATLLRDRLRAACSILAVALALSFVSNLFRVNIPLPGLRAAFLVALSGCTVLVHVRRSFSLRTLRSIELAVFGVVVGGGGGGANATVQAMHLPWLPRV